MLNYSNAFLGVNPDGQPNRTEYSRTETVTVFTDN